jgi:hypothetical protein
MRAIKKSLNKEKTKHGLECKATKNDANWSQCQKNDRWANFLLLKMDRTAKFFAIDLGLAIYSIYVGELFKATRTID